MPLYDYKCLTCARVTEVRHGFNDTNAALCPGCGGALQRVFNAAPILFKGSGFYITDSRNKKSSAAPASAETTSGEATVGDVTPSEPTAPKATTPAVTSPTESAA